MSIENHTPVPVFIANEAAPIFATPLESNGSIVAHEGHGGLPVANGPETHFANIDLTSAAGVLAAAGVLSTVR